VREITVVLHNREQLHADQPANTRMARCVNKGAWTSTGDTGFPLIKWSITGLARLQSTYPSPAEKCPNKRTARFRPPRNPPLSARVRAQSTGHTSLRANPRSGRAVGRWGPGLTRKNPIRKTDQVGRSGQAGPAPQWSKSFHNALEPGQIANDKAPGAPSIRSWRARASAKFVSRAGRTRSPSSGSAGQRRAVAGTRKPSGQHQVWLSFEANCSPAVVVSRTSIRRHQCVQSRPLPESTRAEAPAPWVPCRLVNSPRQSPYTPRITYPPSNRHSSVTHTGSSAPLTSLNRIRSIESGAFPAA